MTCEIDLFQKNRAVQGLLEITDSTLSDNILKLFTQQVYKQILRF